jgi:hypothetical protein
MPNPLNISGVRGGSKAQSLKAFGTAGNGGVLPSRPTPVRTTGLAAANGKLQFTLSDVLESMPISEHGSVAEIIGIFGGTDQLRNAVSQLLAGC